MFLKKQFNKKTGRTYLCMAYTYKDREKDYPRTKIVESFGYLDELQKTYDDPIAHFTALVEERSKAAKEESAGYTITADKRETLPENASNRMNYGHIAILKIYGDLGLDRFLAGKRRATKIESDTNAMMKLLVISRILSPGSKLKAFDEKGRYFDFDKKVNFGIMDIYRCLPYFAGLASAIQLLIHKRITEIYGRNTDLIYYDVTNYYFETDEEDGFKMKGASKEHRPDPIVQMGLATDAEGLPISYEIFAGNESEKLRLRPMILELHKKYAEGKVIAVADAAQNTGNNIYYLDRGKQGYVFSQSIRGGSKAFKEYVADESGYEWYGSEYKRKSRIERREIQVDFEKGDKISKKKVLVDQRQIVFHSEKYAARAKAKREAAIKKAFKIIGNPAEYTRATSYGALKYVKNIEVDKETGEIRPAKAKPCFNSQQLAEDERYDGYYCIVTNVFDEGKDRGKFGDDKIIDIYRGLWRVEDSFRITKHELEARPIYLSREDRINGHFLICYVALAIMRLLQKETGCRHSAAKLIEAMNDISCSNETENLYLFDYRSEIADDLGKALSIDFTRKRLTRGEIRRNLGAVKKGGAHR